ncbi:hypothetical protein J3B02_001210 [Coemansia erecta]|nr:hypothetical protein J3B02_001210 [Coemansia erecta]
MAKNHFGEKKMQVNKEALKSRHPLNIAKMQDRHWEEIRRRVAVPVSPKVMNMLEKRAEDGIIKITREMSELDSVQAQLVNQWVGRWVKMPPKRQIIRYYRSLLEQITEMKVEKILVPNQVNFYRSMARKNTRTESGREEPDLVPKRSFMFRKSPLSGKRPLPPVSCIDIANI